MSTLVTLRTLLPFVRRYRSRYLLGLVLTIVAAALGSVLPWLMRIAVDELAAGASPLRIARLGAAMLGLALVGGGLRFWMREILNGVSRVVETDLRDALFVRLSELDAAFYARWRTGELMARLTNDLNAVRQAVGPALMYLVNTIAGGAFALVFMVRIDLRLTVLALLPLVLLPVVMVRLGRAVHDRFEAVQEQFGALTTQAQEHLAGVRVVRAYRQERAESARFAALNDEYLRRNVSLAQLNGVMNPAFGLLAGLGAAVVIGVGGMLALRGTITVGAFVAFGIYLAMLTWPMIALGWTTNLFQRGAASTTRLAEILDARPSVTRPPAARPLPPLDAARTGRRITLRDVGFHFPTPDGAAPRWVLRHVSVDLAPGDTLGVVGAVGSGKSALVDLVPRLHDPQEGEILVDGVPLRELDLDALRREIGYVPQESLLFSDTIEANIRYGLDADGIAPPLVAADDGPASGARVEDALASTGGATSGATEPDALEVVRWAADVAQLDETVSAFPGGYATVLGERGVNLSGGQKQRTAIARALARRPSIVLLDDALAAVDTHTEAAILRGLRHALAGRTTILATHRLAALRDATWIIVLDEGRIVEQGTHEQLVAANGRYAALWRRQRLEADIEATPDDGAAEGDADHDDAGAARRPESGLGGERAGEAVGSG